MLSLGLIRCVVSVLFQKFVLRVWSCFFILRLMVAVRGNLISNALASKMLSLKYDDIIIG